MTPFKNMKRISPTADQQESKQQISGQCKKKKRNLFSYKPLFAGSNGNDHNKDVNKGKKV